MNIHPKTDQKSYILVTGGAGYIGSVVCEILLKEDYSVIVIDDLSEGNRAALSDKILFFEGNFGDKDLLDEIFQNYSINFVFHFAALANVPDSVINPSHYYKNNLLNSFVLLEKMGEYAIDKIIFSSTAAVFGEPIYTPIDENHPKNPINPYGNSKLMLEQILTDFALAYGLKYVVFRYFCAAGATNEHGESRAYESHLIPVVLDQALGKRASINIFGNQFPTPDGTGVRDYIHVMDIANAHILGMKNFTSVQNEDFNLGSNQGYSVLEIIQLTQSLLNKELVYQFAPIRKGDPAILVASHEKAKEKLAWVPKYDINEIILSSYLWRNNPNY